MPGDVDCQQWSVRHPANVARNREVIEKEKEQNRYDDEHGKLDTALGSLVAAWRDRIIGGVAPVADDGEECSDDQDIGDDRHSHHEVKELLYRRCLWAGGIEN